MSSIRELTESDFDQVVLHSSVPVVVDFWSPSCGPCRTLVPILESVGNENDGAAIIAKVNVAVCPTLGQKYGIEMLPTLLFFNNGRVAERMVGVQSQDKIQSALDELA